MEEPCGKDVGWESWSDTEEGGGKGEDVCVSEGLSDGGGGMEDSLSDPVKR